MSKTKVRKVLVHIENDELQRIVSNELGGVTIEIIVTHANIKVDARTGEDQKVALYQIK
jgi:hypothetical protein